MTGFGEGADEGKQSKKCHNHAKKGRSMLRPYEVGFVIEVTILLACAVF